MLVELFFTLVSYLVKLFIIILPSWDIWPDAVKNGIAYVVQTIARLNFIIPVETLFDALTFFITFISLYYLARLILMIINWLRGAGGIEI